MEPRAKQFAEERNARILLIWEKFRETMIRQGLIEPTKWLGVICEYRMRSIMRNNIIHGRPSGFGCPSALDAFDLGIHDYQPRPAERPTATAPGSKEKIEVMAERLASGQELYHPQDNTIFAGK